MECALLLIVHFTGLLIESTDWSKPKNQLSIPSEMFKPNDKFFWDPVLLQPIHLPYTYTVYKENKVAQNRDKSNFFLHTTSYNES